MSSLLYIFSLSLHDALPIFIVHGRRVEIDDAVDRRVAAVLAFDVVDDRADVVAEVLAPGGLDAGEDAHGSALRSEEHTSELQSLRHFVCRLLIEIHISKTFK